MRIQRSKSAATSSFPAGTSLAPRAPAARREGPSSIFPEHARPREPSTRFWLARRSHSRRGYLPSRVIGRFLPQQWAMSARLNARKLELSKPGNAATDPYRRIVLREEFVDRSSSTCSCKPSQSSSLHVDV